ncbi:Cytochrome c oxidase subunit IV [Catalinimonas alkaloidigena]|uniref:Cytochrome c oxidase subunit IV n=1 Tax=Catalinimonas alkaloidigena TaxID=1075417 RepID=A0A1G9BIL9_9BACT|nr:cytochrome C oxidase subunit IV family protein [Catalinimonas alkaloidigena]SDK39307.1 Cytochrome c oxidase subunit IV [Catalinimonas alkaloidigena]
MAEHSNITTHGAVPHGGGQVSAEQAADHGASQRKIIWRTFWILLGITSVEFLLAFTMKRGVFLTGIFVLLTLVKAFYIVGEFMHLKHEVKSLIWSIVMPVVFIMWLILALLIEGGSILQVR